MLKSCFVCLHLAVIGICVLEVSCFSEDEESAISVGLQPLVVDCIEDCDLPIADIKKEKREHTDPCFRKCFLKKLGLLNDDGKYDREAVREQVLMYTDNEDEADKLQSALDECFKDKEDALNSDRFEEIKRVNIIFDCLKNYKQYE